MLLEELELVFGTRRFDATDVFCQAHARSALLAAIEDEVPGARDRHGSLNTRAIRRALRKMRGIKAHYTRGVKYWTFRVDDRTNLLRLRT
jgi:hypothetical protein